MSAATLCQAGPRDAAGLRAALDREEAAAAAAGRELDRLSERRCLALLANDDDELDRIEAEMVRARRAADRADLMLLDLQARLDGLPASPGAARLAAFLRFPAARALDGEAAMTGGF